MGREVDELIIFAGIAVVGGYAYLRWYKGKDMDTVFSDIDSKLTEFTDFLVSKLPPLPELPPPPTFNFPELPQAQAAPAPSLPVEQPTTTSSSDDGEEPENESKAESKSPPTTTVSPPPASASQAPAAGGLIWDSNVQGKWKGGTGKGLKKYGSNSPGGGGMSTAASGNPTFDLDGNGVMHLESSDLGRVYIYAKNYNARLEGNFMFEVHHGAKDNISIKIRSRHNHSGRSLAGGGGEPCGGVGVAFHPDGQVELAAESAHGTNPTMGGGKAPPFQTGKWYKFAFSVWDDGSGVSSKAEIDGKVVGTGKWASPNTQCHTKSLFDTDSYFWLRLNSYGGRDRVAFSNLRLYNLGGASSQQYLLLNAP